MNEIIRIGLDTSKSVFQVHGVDAAERPVLRKTLRRADMERFFASLPPTLIGLEACGASHHWARVLQRLGHQVRLLPPQYVTEGNRLWFPRPGCQGLVRFFALLRIEPHAPPLVRAPVNSFEF